MKTKAGNSNIVLVIIIFILLIASYLILRNERSKLEEESFFDIEEEIITPPREAIQIEFNEAGNLDTTNNQIADEDMSVPELVDRIEEEMKELEEEFNSIELTL